MNEGIRGLRSLMDKYGSLDKAAEEGVKKAVGKGNHVVQSAARLLCPVNDGELRRSIMTQVDMVDDKIIGTTYTNKKYAAYVEFGTGPKGEADHAGISPEVSPSYSQSPWWIHESQIDKETAEKYHMFAIETQDGIFYQTSGQAAQPFLYPGFKNSEELITKTINDTLSKEIRKACK